MPFSFWTSGSPIGVPCEIFRQEDSAPHAAIRKPDVELHQNAKDAGEGVESGPVSEDSTDESNPNRIYGWSGSWTREFIRRDEQRKGLGVSDLWRRKPGRRKL